MKTYLTYGFAMALANAVLTLVLYLLGYHSDAAKFASASWISYAGLLAIAVTCIVLGTKARRAELPAEKDFTYGGALAAGVMICLFAGLFGLITNYVYMEIINPGYGELILQNSIAKQEANNVSSAQIEQMEKGMRFVMKPAVMGALAFLSTVFWGTLISLVTSAFLKRVTDKTQLMA